MVDGPGDASNQCATQESPRMTRDRDAGQPSGQRPLSDVPKRGVGDATRHEVEFFFSQFSDFHKTDLSRL